MNHEINFYPEGCILTLKNKDVPGVVGRVGTILGKEDINIAEYILSRPHLKENGTLKSMLYSKGKLDSPGARLQNRRCGSTH